MMIDKIEKYRDEMQGRIYKHFKGTRYSMSIFIFVARC